MECYDCWTCSAWVQQRCAWIVWTGEARWFYTQYCHFCWSSLCLQSHRLSWWRLWILPTHVWRLQPHASSLALWLYGWLLECAGQLDDTEELINKMSLDADSSVWNRVLGACRIHGNIQLAELVVKNDLSWKDRMLLCVCWFHISMLQLACGQHSKSEGIDEG